MCTYMYMYMYPLMHVHVQYLLIHILVHVHIHVHPCIQIINKSKPKTELSEEEKHKKMMSFMDRHEKEIKKYGMMKDYSARYNVQQGSVKGFRSVFVQWPCNNVYHSIFVPFPFLLHSVFSFTCLAHHL